MKYRTRIYCFESQKALMWDRWQKGHTLHQATKLFDRYHTSIRGILAKTGGIRPVPRRRSRLALTLVERTLFEDHVAQRTGVRFVRHAMR
jgi:hypothetical protein